MVGFGAQNEESKDFYIRNIGIPVNLFTANGTTYSGDLARYDPDRGLVVLANSIQRVYSRDGTSSFVESEFPFIIKESSIVSQTRTTREDRLGRIANYNKDLEIEKLESLSRTKDSLKIILSK